MSSIFYTKMHQPSCHTPAISTYYPLQRRAAEPEQEAELSEGVDFPSCQSPGCDFAQQPEGSLASSPWSSPRKLWSCCLPHTRLWQTWEQQKHALCTVSLALLTRACSSFFLNGCFLPFLRNLFYHICVCCLLERREE